MTPLVIAFVLALAFVLLVAPFRSPRLAVSVIGLNLLSVGAAFGVLTAVFQHHWAQSLLGFQLLRRRSSTGCRCSPSWSCSGCRWTTRC